MQTLTDAIIKTRPAPVMVLDDEPECFTTTNAPAVNAKTSPADGKRLPLTVRSIDEIMAIKIDPDTLILDNGYLARGERTAFLGMGGIGKSRLVMQLAFCIRAGRDFLEWETNGANLRWLFFQTENSVKRLQADIPKMLASFTTDEQAAIRAGVFFHTLETDDDGLIYLDDLEHYQRVLGAIAANTPDVVVWDPLRDCSYGDLNGDHDMSKVLRLITQATKRGNPKRTALVLHHAATGKAGIQKVVGFDRSSFGRNSKALHGWARAQINVAPAMPDDNNLLIMASGKFNDGVEFSPFAIRLNPETMMYAPDWTFDVDGWRDRIENPSGSKADRLDDDAVISKLPTTGSIEKGAFIRQLNEAGLGGQKLIRKRLEELTSNGPVHEWQFKRPGKRDEIHVARYAQPAA